MENTDQFENSREGLGTPSEKPSICSIRASDRTGKSSPKPRRHQTPVAVSLVPAAFGPYNDTVSPSFRPHRTIVVPAKTMHSRRAYP